MAKLWKVKEILSSSRTLITNRQIRRTSPKVSSFFPRREQVLSRMPWDQLTLSNLSICRVYPKKAAETRWPMIVWTVCATFTDKIITALLIGLFHLRICALQRILVSIWTGAPSNQWIRPRWQSLSSWIKLSRSTSGIKMRTRILIGLFPNLFTVDPSQSEWKPVKWETTGKTLRSLPSKCKIRLNTTENNSSTELLIVSLKPIILMIGGSICLLRSRMLKSLHRRPSHLELDISAKVSIWTHTMKT